MKQQDQTIRNLEEELAALERATILVCRRIHLAQQSKWNRCDPEHKESLSVQNRILHWLKGILQI